MYATSASDMCEKFDRLMQLTAVADSECCTAYFSMLWDCRQDWVFALRIGLHLRGSNTTNYTEVAFRILKDCVFDRVMTFTLQQLVDFIVVHYEAYMQKWLTDFSSGRYTKALLCNWHQTCATFHISEVHAAAGLYTVLSSCGSNWYSDDLMRGFCTCFVGAAGKLCKHAPAELLYRDVEICTGYKIIVS